MDWKFATTLIGSLPFIDANEAVNSILENGIDCPSWPQLPRRGYMESMYIQTGEKLPGLKVEDDKLFVDLNDYDPTEAYMAILEENIDFFLPSNERNSGLFALLSKNLTSYKAVKGQVTGPISEGLQIQDIEGRPVIYNESYGEIVRKTVNCVAKWQATELKKKNDNVIIFYDEPSLSLLGTPFASISSEEAKAWINESMEGVDAFKAIHCCGNTDWPMVLSTNIDILNFDAYGYGKAFVLYPEEISKFIERGGSIAWGIIPNNEFALDETPESLADRLCNMIDTLSNKGVNKNKLILSSMLTPQCGLGGTDMTLYPIVLSLLSETSKEMKKRFGL